MMSVLDKSSARRKILIHINNSNPILLDDSPQRAELGVAALKSPTTAWRLNCERCAD